MRGRVRALAVAAGASLALGAAAAPARAQIQRPNPDDVVSFAGFVDPVNLTTLVDFVSRTLGVNIFLQEPNLGGAQIQFRAPMDVRAGDLMSMLELLLETRGFAMTEEGDGWYVIRPNQNLPPSFGGEQFSTTQIIATPLIRPSSLQSVVSNVLSGDANARILYSDELGVVISTAAARVNRAVAQAIREVQDRLAQQEYHRIDLQHISAEEARLRLLTLLGQSAGQAAAPQGARPAAAAGAPAAATTSAVAAGAFSNLPQRLLIDRRGNSLIFHGTAEEVASVESLVSVVDAPTSLIVRRYNAGPLSNEVAYFGARQGLGPVRSSAQQAAEEAAAGSMFVLGGEEAQSFTYFGTEAQHEQVKALVEQFASQAQEERIVVEFYKLQNMKAEDASSLVQELLNPQQGPERGQRAQSPFLPPSVERTRGLRRVGDLGRGGGAPPTAAQPYPQPSPGAPAMQGQEGAAAPTGAAPSTGGAPSAGGEEGATITPSENVQIFADEKNNQLVVRAPVRQQREIAAIIQRIDQRRPQVLLDVQIVSINVSDSFSLNIDTALNPGLEQVFQGLSDIAEASFIGGSTSVIIDSSQTPLIVRAIATASNSRVVSQPGVLVNDNETATVGSTTDISFASTTQVAGAPSQTSVGGTLSAGTNLSITPSISVGGFMKLELSVELSNFGQSSSGGQNLPPDRNTNRFESVVTVPADSTVVVGGLISEQTQNNETKVPILGDIPIVGNLFKNQTRSTNRSVIYVFITPRVLRDPTFADLRLLTKGPAAESGLDVGLPPLQPALMPIVEQRRADAGSGGQ